MDNANAKWEVVSYGKKKPQGQKITKSQKKKLAESMPTLDKNDYMAKLKTGFTIDGDNTSGSESDGFSPVEMKAKKQNSPAKQSKKVVQKPKSVKPPTVKEILNNMDVNELKTDFTLTSQAFPDKPLIWLTDLAAAIDRKIPPGTQGLEREWYSTSSDDKLFPLSEMNISASRYLTTIVENQSPNVLGSYIYSCCQQLMLLVSRGTNTSNIGIRIMLQLIFKRSPRFLLINSADLAKLTADSVKTPPQFFALYWCFTQAGRLSFDVGMRVLLDLLFPHINVKAFGNAIVSFAEELISLSNSGRQGSEMIGYRDFFPLLDVMHASVYDEKSIPTNIAPNLMKRLQALYPRTKAMSLLCRNEDELKQFFPSLLYRLRPKGGGKLTEELLLCLVHCLINSPQCFGVWKQMHPKHINQSNILLCHLVKQWNWLQKRLKRSAVRDLLSYFVKNHSKDPPKSDGHYIAMNAQLLVGNSGPSVMERVFRFLFMVLTASILLLTLDVYTRGSYRSSRTRTFLHSRGLAEPMEEKFDAFLVTAGPYATAASHKLCCIRPYAVAVWQYLQWLVHTAYEVMQPYCLLLWQKMEPYFLEIEKQWPHVVEVASQYLQLVGEYLVKAFWIAVGYLEIVWNYLQQFDWSPVVAFGNSCYSTAAYYIQRVYSSVAT